MFKTKKFLKSLVIAIPITWMLYIIPVQGEPTIAKNESQIVEKQTVELKPADLSGLKFEKVLDPKERVFNELDKLGELDKETWLRIAQAESGFQVTVEPESWVKHCQRSDGSYYAVELSDCGDDIQVHQEKSYGVFQILPSTAKRVCELDWKDSVETQTRCAVNIKNKSGFDSWSTF